MADGTEPAPQASPFKDWRRRVLTGPLFAWYKRVLPPMSDTEREALEAGTVWWDAELFSGAPDWSKLHAAPKAELNAEEQAFVDGPTDDLCAMLDDWRINFEWRDLPPEVWDFIKEHRFFGMIIPKEHGGLGFSALAHSQVVSKIATRSITAAVTVMVPNSLGPAELLLHYGTDEQRRHYLPRLAKGEDIPCFALTGPYAGSDAASLPDIGIVCKGTYNGKETLGLRGNWEKRYITLGPVATVMGLALQTHDPDHLLGDVDDLGITVALVPTDTPGVEIGRRHYPVHQAFLNGPNKGKDVFIPFDWVIGGQDNVGKGWRMLMDSLAAGRGISLPSLSAGGAKFCARTTGAYGRVRKQFKVPVGKFEGVQEALARIGGRAYMAESMRRLTAIAVDMGEKPSVLSAIAKLHGTDMLRATINDAMDVHGGKGICDGPSNYLANVYHAMPVSITVEGANILTRSLIVFGQGAIRCHP
ncbi:MAG: acyl-CoA dehydrogenase, partial [Rhodobacteraceae bacterium]|nr:acyl-CoA dehydrogenase [Paracoccaceae bacterium]